MSRRTHCNHQLHLFTYGTFTLFGGSFQNLRLRQNLTYVTGCSAFARHYSRNCFFSSGYLDVSVPLVPSYRAMCSLDRPQACPCAGFPIRISPAYSGCTRLPGAFRSVPRPSSARDAQAFPIRPGSFSSNMCCEDLFYLALHFFFLCLLVFTW